MSDSDFAILALSITGLLIVGGIVRILTVNKGLTGNDIWTIEKKALNIIVGLISGPTLAAAIKLFIVGLKISINKDILPKLDDIQEGELIQQLLDDSVYIVIASGIFTVIWGYGIVLTYRKK